MVYLDDGICSVQADRAETPSKFVQSSLQQAGFVAHSVKSQWIPSYQISWLGFDIDLLNGAIIVPSLKVEAIRNLVSSALRQGLLTSPPPSEYCGKDYLHITGHWPSCPFYD